MAPDPVMFSSACTSTRTSGSSKRHKTGTQHRGKTARIKKKKLWQQFSPWDSNTDNDFEESDLIHFCRSKGITKSTAAASFSQARAHTTNSLFTTGKDVRQKRQMTASSHGAKQTSAPAQDKTSNPASFLEDSSYTKHLCSFLTDKKKFIRESLGIKENLSNSSPDTEQEKHRVNCIPTSKRNPDVEDIKGTSESQEIAKSHKQETSTHQPGTAMDDEKGSTSTDSSSNTVNRALPKISPYSKHGSAASSRTKSAAKNGSALPYTNDGHQNAFQKNKVREWSAEVETEIMRLYENSGPGINCLTTLDSKSHPRTLSKVKDQVESKLSSADHTPSYVLALANLFRRRMQIRKEFSQAAGEMINNSIKTAASDPSPITNAFPQQLPKSSYLSAAGHSLITAPETPVSLRYHHVSSASNLSSASAMPVQTVTAKPSPVTFCSISLPLAGIAQHQAQATQAEEPKLEINTLKTDEKAERNETTKVTLKQANINNDSLKYPKDEDLETLLTVFPKHPQLKFASFDSSKEKHSGSTKEARRIQRIFSDDIFPQRESTYNEHGRQDSAEALVMSLTETLKKDHRNTFPTELKIEQRQHSGQKGFKQLTDSRRNCHSAGLGAERTVIPNRHKAILQRSSKWPLKETKRNAGNVLSLETLNCLDNETDILFPMSEVRWTGSLGTLYPKPKMLSDPILGTHGQSVKTQLL